MKSVITIFVLMFPAILWGQIKNHFDNIDSKWNVAKTYPAANQQNPNFVATTTTIFGFRGDTLINEQRWFKLYSTNDSLFQEKLIYRGLTRTENNCVFYLDTLNQLDTLYNFNLNLGDSNLFKLNGISTEWLQIINIDSIQLNGAYYKRYKFEEPSISAFDLLNEVWIEGIGSIHGPLFPNFPVKFSGEIPDSMLLTCSYSSNQNIWHHSTYSSCYINITLGLETTEVFNLKIYPNPVIENFNFEYYKNGNFSLTILNGLGQVVRQIQMASNNGTIDLSDLNDGIYFLKIKDKINTQTLKIIKEH